MALIAKFESTSSDTQSIHGQVACGYRAFTADGRRILQLDTYGSAQRKITGKVSQSIQLEAEEAHQLIEIIRDSFPGLTFDKRD